MTKKMIVGIGVTGLAVAAGAAGLRRRRHSSDRDGEAATRWNVVTIQRPPADVVHDQHLPEPLAALNGLIDVRWSIAPGGRGTELRARPHTDGRDEDDDELRGAVRVALRESKQLLEVGHVLTNHPQPEGRRPHTPAGAIVDALVRRSPEEGVL
ncbi:hypothetical protein [Herbiconiux daphne]|uniref:Uncharacterized protein n=1 Tax=Herbiconiux daphne TaxID=2970914 RepID=A0ABT2GX04_9MICO|nr:hypothetical protein [Herbiconiux daphne]MCS5732485.1 hypothetical protein [Herbiconiux daphne]